MQLKFLSQMAMLKEFSIRLNFSQGNFKRNDNFNFRAFLSQLMTASLFEDALLLITLIKYINLDVSLEC